MCRGRRARILLHLHIQREKIVVRVCSMRRRGKVRHKSKNLQGKEAALTHTNGHTGRASTVSGRHLAGAE